MSNIVYGTTLPSQGDTKINLLGKLLQKVGGFASPGDTEADLLAKLLAIFNGGTPGGGGAWGDITGTLSDQTDLQTALNAKSSIISGTSGARPSAGTSGRLYLPTDGLTADYDTGSLWRPYGPIWPMTPVVDADFSWVNQGSATTTTVGNRVEFRGGLPTGGLFLQARVKAAPATPYTIKACVIPTLIGVAGKTAEVGLCFRQSGVGALSTVSITTNNAADGASITQRDWSTPTAISATGAQFGWATSGPIWFSITDDGANRSVKVSSDGYIFTTLYTVGRTSFLTADQVGFYVFTNSGTTNTDVAGTFLSWVQS